MLEVLRGLPIRSQRTVCPPLGAVVIVVLGLLPFECMRKVEALRLCAANAGELKATRAVAGLAPLTHRSGTSAQRQRGTNYE